MNKNIKLILNIGAAIAVIIVGVVLYFIFGPKLPIEQILPKGAIAYVRLQHPAAYWQKGEKSEFFNQIASIDIAEVLEHNNISKEHIKQIEKSKEQIVAFFKNPLTQRFLEKEIAVVLYQHGSSFEPLMVLRLPISMRAVMATSLLANQLTDKFKVSSEIYKGRTIVHVALKDNTLAFKYTVVGDLLIVSAEKEPSLTKVIDVVLKQAPSLKDDIHFEFAINHAYGHADSLAFVNIEQLPFKKTGISTYAFSFLPGVINKYRFSLGINLSESQSPLVKLASCQSPVNGSLPFIPSNIVSYQWNSCYDFTDIWNQASKHIEDVSANDKQTNHFIKSVEKRLKLNVKSDLLPVLGDEAGGYLTDIDTLGVFPYPRLLAFVKVNDRAKAEEVLTKLTKGRLGFMQEEEYNQVGIHYVPLPLGANMDPGYCFVGDYLLAATSRQLLKKSIDTYKAPETSIKTERTFNSLDLQAMPQAQSVTYMKVGEFSRRLKDIFNWTEKYLSSQVTSVMAYKQESNQQKAEIFDDIASKQEELSLAQAKLKELKSKDLSVLSMEDQEIQQDNMKNIQVQMENLSDEIKQGKSQTLKIDKELLAYQLQAEQAQMMMYNTKHVVVPLLNGLESLNALGMRVFVKDKTLETELLVN